MTTTFDNEDSAVSEDRCVDRVAIVELINVSSFETWKVKEREKERTQSFQLSSKLVMA